MPEDHARDGHSSRRAVRRTHEGATANGARRVETAEFLGTRPDGCGARRLWSDGGVPHGGSDARCVWRSVVSYVRRLVDSRALWAAAATSPVHPERACAQPCVRSGWLGESLVDTVRRLASSSRHRPRPLLPRASSRYLTQFGPTSQRRDTPPRAPPRPCRGTSLTSSRCATWVAGSDTCGGVKSLVVARKQSSGRKKSPARPKPSGARRLPSCDTQIAERGRIPGTARTHHRYAAVKGRYALWAYFRMQPADTDNRTTVASLEL